MKCCLFLLLVVLSVNAGAQSLFYADSKAAFLKELEGKSIADVRKELADGALEIKDIKEQFKRLEKFFDVKSDKTYTEATAVKTDAYTLPDEKLVEERFNETVSALAFKQHFELPDAGFEIIPTEKEHRQNYLELDYQNLLLYRGGKSFAENEVGLKSVDSLKAVATYSIPTKMATVKISAGQKTATYRNAKIYLDVINKSHVSFRVDTAINDDLLEVFALTKGGKLVDHSGYRNSSNKDDGSFSKFMEETALFLDAFVADIDAGKFKTRDALIADLSERLTKLKLPERSPMNYKEYDFKGNVQTLVLYFREDQRKFRQDITAYNKDKTNSGYQVFKTAGGQCGICDAAGNIIIDAKYKELNKVNDNYYYAATGQTDYTCYYFDRSARKLIPLTGVDYIDDQGNGMVVSRKVVKKDKAGYDDVYTCGLYNTKGIPVIPDRYAALELMGNVVLYRMKEDGKYGVLDLEGKMLAAEEYDQIKPAIDERTDERYPVIVVEKNGQYSLMGQEGKLLCPLQYDYPIAFSEGRAVVGRREQDQKRFGVLDITGRLLVPLQYDYISEFRDEVAVYGKDEKYGLLNATGKTVVNAAYRWMGDISDGMVIVRNEQGQCGAFDNKGELKIPFRFSEIKAFQAGYAFVFTEDHYGVIDKTGKFTMQAPKPSSYAMSTNWEGKERTYQINDKEYNYKGELIKSRE